MLEPEYFNNKADRMLEIYRQLEDFILKDISARLLKSESIPGTADRMIWKLQQMGASHAEIMNKLTQLTGLSRRELKTLLQDAVMTSWDDDLSTFNKIGVQLVNPLENAAVMSVMNAEYRKSQRELENLTRTAMNQSQQDLVRMLDEAEVRVASGLQSYSSAVCKILDNYAGKGLLIDYPSGTKRSLEAAVRMCVVTSMNQTSAQITNQYIVEGKIEYVLVSAHMGARVQQPGQPYLAGHENWQGKAYRIRGSELGYPNLLESTGYDIDDDGTGHVVNLLGLHGYNCRHSHKPWDKSLRNPYVDENGNLKIDSEESRKLYENQQKQRAMERSIRKTKRELLMKQQEINMIAETDVKEMLQPEYDKLAYKLRQQNKAYNEFCDKNDLQRQSDRLKVAGFKREQAAKSTGRARAYEHWKLNSETSVDSADVLKVIKSNVLKNINLHTEHKPISINDIQGEYADKIREIIYSSPDNIKSIIEKYANDIRFTNEKYIGTGHTNKSGIAVNFLSDSINRRGAWTTTFHEIGHAVDRSTARISSKYPKFRSYLESDFNLLVKEYQSTYNIDIQETYSRIGSALEPYKYHSLSDLAGGMTKNQCVGEYLHTKPGYWETPNRLEREAFAHFFEATARNDIEKLTAIKEMFPNAYSEFEVLLEEIL